MPGPNPQAAGDTSKSQWWVVQTPMTGRGAGLLPPQLSVTMATSRPRNAVAGPYLSKTAAEQFITNAEQGGSISLPSWLNPASWLSDIGGKLASGIEAGFLQIVKDLWGVIVGPLEVLLGVVIAMYVLGIYFKNDIMKLAGTMASAMALAG
jgi:hypothetical protein